jgi:hypothetical protein
MDEDCDIPRSKHRLKREGQLDVPQFSTVHDMLAWEAEQERVAKEEKERIRIEGNRKRSESVSRYQQAKKRAREAIKAQVAKEEDDIMNELSNE